MVLSVAAAAQQERTNHFGGTNLGVHIAVQELKHLRTSINTGGANHVRSIWWVYTMGSGIPHYLRVVLPSRSWHRLWNWGRLLIYLKTLSLGVFVHIRNGTSYYERVDKFNKMFNGISVWYVVCVDFSCDYNFFLQFFRIKPVNLKNKLTFLLFALCT
jgi:hypothetical protein